ncbi:MAG: pentapeptide repeat-containing protein [Ardenticatenaceae bacterium]|nr:pentapeptide repeat-containing protein [Ardenticatenaceae bacterium]MCB9443033.1 pentapeptide repeat-containing protein [Ardenticatenaceae bacterium]
MSKIDSTNKDGKKVVNRDSKITAWLFITLILVISILVILGYIFSWAPIGVVKYSYKTDGTLEGVKDIKTLWDWLDLFIIPVLIAVGIWWITRLDEKAKWHQEKQDEINRKLREDQFRTEQQTKHDLEKELSIDTQRQVNLESYFDRITNLILEWGLLDSSDESAVRTIARAITLATFRGLDGHRKGRLVRFLAEAKLISGPQPKIILSGADMRQINLQKANFNNINLTRANLSNSMLNQINLNKAHLIRCKLTGATISHANLRQAKLDRANLNSSNLVETNLSDASLIKVSFKDADLRKAILTTAKVNGANFTNADLRGTDLQYTNLDGVKLFGVKYDSTTKWPKGFEITSGIINESVN